MSPAALRKTGLNGLALVVAAVSLSACAVIPCLSPAAADTGSLSPFAAATSSCPPPMSAPGAAPASAAAVRGQGAHPGQSTAALSSAPSAGLPSFAAMTKDARRIDGMLTLWRKDDKVWIELRPQDFSKPLFFSPKIAQGLGEPGFYGGSMASRYADFGAPQIVEFRRIHNVVQLIARNQTFMADAGTPEVFAVEAGYSHSLLASTVVASQPSLESSGVLIEANNLFLTDILGMAVRLQDRYRQNYVFDSRNSFFDDVRGSATELVFGVSAHYATGSIAFAAPNAAPGVPVPRVPSFLPDVRSLFLGLHYSLARLPEVPMQPREADPRIGYFTTTVANFSDDTKRTPRERFISRWRLEKKDPAAELSEPVRPITYWLDRSIPLKYRSAITNGILEWNKAFERIGFKNAIVVKTQAVDANFDTLDVGAASVRWMVNAQASFGAIGPHHVDPRSGEILDADMAIESLSSRNQRAQRAQVLSVARAFDWPALLQTATTDVPLQTSEPRGQSLLNASPRDRSVCEASDYGAEELGYGLDVLAARGEIDPGSPQADTWVKAYLTDITMHEVGHTLGLRHNFRASRLYSERQLSDPEFTHTHALTASVMDYAPVNLPLAGEVGGAPFQSTLGPYDYWAIEYAYKPLPLDATPVQRHEALLKVASRSTEPGLAFGTDEDNFLGVDPESLQFDLGNEPVAFAAKRFAIAHELFARQESRPLKETEDYAVLRRSVTYALRDATRAAGVLLRQLGGVATLRHFPGAGRGDPMEPVSAPKQRQALDVLVEGVFGSDQFQVSPALQRRLAPDFLERADASAGGEDVSTDYPVETVMLDFQRQVLAALMSDGLAQRLEDSAPKFDKAADALMPGEVYARLTRTLWSEAKSGDIPLRRRELQRDYVNRLANVLLHTPAGVRVDMRTHLRAESVELLPRIRVLLRHFGLSRAARLHLTDCEETLRLALAAPMQRAGY